MKLPKQIFPNPLVVSVVELRITSEMNSEELFPFIYSKFGDKLPKLKTSKISKDAKISNPKLRHAPDFTISNDTYSMSFSPLAISIQVVDEYPLWNNYFLFIREQLSKVFALDFIKKIDRIGVRYSSVFQEFDNLQAVLLNIPKIELNVGEEESFKVYTTVIKKGENRLFLQLVNDATITKNEKKINGAFIDIDASCTKDLDANKRIFDIIDELHSGQKQLFFSLLKPEFLETLKPKY